MVGIFALMGLSNPESYFNIDNFTSMAFQFPEIGIIAIGVMLAMLTGGIDLSMVGTANLAGIIAAMFMVHAIPEDATVGTQAMYVFFAFLIVAAVGLVCGLINGLIISKVGTPPILATLGTMQVFMGIAIIITEGRAVLGFPEFFADIGNGALFGVIPYPLIFFVLITVIMYFVLHKTSFGIKLYMMGTNIHAAEFSGVNTGRMINTSYSISGLLAGIAGFILIARTNQAKADYGTSYTLQSILVAVLGGVNPSGGFGSIGGIVIAVLTLQFLSTGMNMLSLTNVNFLRDFVWGLALVIVMAADYLRNRNKDKKPKQA
jgi:simple sugar transport system permease protein